jgi:hypothetical protein
MYLIVYGLDIFPEFITSFLFPSFSFSLIIYLPSNDSLLPMLLQKNYFVLLYFTFFFFFFYLFFLCVVEASGRCPVDLDYLLKILYLFGLLVMVSIFFLNLFSFKL